MNDEIIYIFNDNFIKIGSTSSIKAHIQGLWHEVFHCWLVDIETDKILYQHRSKLKKVFPNKLDVSVAGHCNHQESIYESVLREAKEELDIDIKKSDLVKIGIRRDSSVNGNIINREFQHIFFAKIELYKHKIKLEKTEVSDLYLIHPNDIINLYENKLKEISVQSILSTSNRIIQKTSFIESVDKYNYKIPFFILQFIQGKNIRYF